MEDFVTWVDTSKLKRTVMEYNDEVSRVSLHLRLTLTFVVAGRLRSIVAPHHIFALYFSYAFVSPWSTLCISSLALPFAKRYLSLPLSLNSFMKISIHPAIPLMNSLLHRAHVHTQGTGEIYAVATLVRGDPPCWRRSALIEEVSRWSVALQWSPAAFLC